MDSHTSELALVAKWKQTYRGKPWDKHKTNKFQPRNRGMTQSKFGAHEKKNDDYFYKNDVSTFISGILDMNELIRNKHDLPSKIRIKRRGESEQPCRRPLSQWKAFVASPLIKIVRVAEEIQPIIQFVVILPNPLWISMRCRKFQFMQSKAFLRSNFRRMACNYLVLIPCMHSCATPTASRICLPLRKPSCSSESVRER